MGHNHSHNHDHHHSDAGIRTAFFLNITFTVIEIIGGILTNSVAILSDALHDLGDSVALGFSWGHGKDLQKRTFRQAYLRIPSLFRAWGTL